MTVMLLPEFINSKYFVMEPGNWHLKPDAPTKVVKEFNNWMKQYKRHKPISKFNKNG